MYSDWIDEVLDTAKKLNGYVDTDTAKRLVVAYIMGDNNGAKQALEDLIGAYADNFIMAENPIEALPPGEEMKGDFRIGQTFQGDLYGSEFCIREIDLLRHVGIYAQTGHSKSTVLYHLMEQFCEKNIRFTLFDRKRDGRALLRSHPNLIVIPWQELRWNPLRNPPKVPVRIWWQLFSEVCGHVWGVYHAGVNYLLEWLSDYLPDVEKGRYPTLVQLRDAMRDKTEYSKKRDEYYQVMWNRVRTLVEVFGDVIAVEEEIHIENLLDKQVVIELDSLRLEEQNLLIELWLLYIYAYRMSERHRGEYLRHVTVVEEAHPIFDAGVQFRDTSVEMGQPIISQVHSLFRDFGEALVITSQTPSQILHSVHANTLVKIVGNLGDATDIKFIQDSLGLTDEQADIVHKLKRGQWIAKINDRYTEPFLLQTSDHPASKIKDVTDEEVKERIKPIIEKLKHQHVEREKPISNEKNETSTVVSEDAWRLLTHVNYHPFKSDPQSSPLGIAARAKALRISVRRIEVARNELVSKNLANVKGVIITAKRPTIFLIPSKEALELLESKGEDTGLWHHIGNVGFEHTLFQVLIRHAYQKLGYKAHIERKINRRRFDVLAVKGNQRIAVEVELQPHNNQDNKLTGTDDLTELYIISNSEDNLRIIRNKLNIDKAKCKVRLSTINKFLALLNNIAREQSGIYSSERSRLGSNRSRNQIKGDEKG